MSHNHKLSKLTDKEFQIFTYYLEFHSLQETADFFGVKPNTIKFHLNRCYFKLGIEGDGHGKKEKAQKIFMVHKPVFAWEHK